MKLFKVVTAALIAAALYSAPLVAQAPAPTQAPGPTVSEKKDVAIFALGFYGFSIPVEALGNIDQSIQKVFVDLGRFNIIGVTQRLSSSGLSAFIDTIKKAKEANFVVPDKYQFGEAVLTEAEFNKLLGAFIVAVPVVSDFNSAYDDTKSQWETNLKADVTFIDVSTGSTIGVAEVKSSGNDQNNQQKSISSAVDGIPMQLQYEIRKIEAFQISTRVLVASGSEIKLQLGKNMGIQKGDEYSIVVSESVEGFKNQSEKGLVQIKDVGSEVSTGRVVYSSIPVTKDIQLQENPRLGVDAEGYFHFAGDTALPGIRGVLSRGFYGFRPYFAAQIPVSQVSSYFSGLFSVIPVNVILGGEFNLYLGRLAITPYGGVGASYYHVITPINSGDTTDGLSHIGGQAYVRASFLFTRELRVFAEAGVEYWASMNPDWFDSYGGLGFGGGVSYKL